MNILLALIAAASPLSGVSVTADDRLAVEVRSDDLNLEQASDIRRLQRRVAFAATRVCNIGGGRSLAAMTWESACRVEAMQRATVRVEQVVAAARLIGEARLSSR